MSPSQSLSKPALLLSHLRLKPHYLLVLVAWSVFLTHILSKRRIAHFSPSDPTSPESLDTRGREAAELLKYISRQSNLRERLLTSLPVCATQGQASSFLIVFMGHSGSTAIITALQQHSAVHVSELEPVDHGKFVEGEKKEAARRALNRMEQYFRNGTMQGKTAGFKIRPRHILASPEDFANVIAKHNTRIVWSYRGNVLKQALGDYVIRFEGDKSGFEGLQVQSNGSAMEPDRRAKTFRVQDMGALHQMLTSRVNGDKLVSQALSAIKPDGCVLPVSYESFLAQPEVTVERIQLFLGLGNDELHSSLRAKATQDSICTLVENWDELCQAFFGCEAWRWMLDDFENGCSCSALHPSHFSKSSKYCSKEFVQRKAGVKTGLGG